MSKYSSVEYSDILGLSRNAKIFKLESLYDAPSDISNSDMAIVKGEIFTFLDGKWIMSGTLAEVEEKIEKMNKREEHRRTFELMEYFTTIDAQWMVFEQCSTGLMMGLNVTHSFKEAYGEIMLHEFNCSCKLVGEPFILEDEDGIGFKFCNNESDPEEVNEDDFDYCFILRNMDYDEKNRERKENNE